MDLTRFPRRVTEFISTLNNRKVCTTTRLLSGSGSSLNTSGTAGRDNPSELAFWNNSV
ncbi:TPA: hypothetical protein SLG82_002968 [Citrobacter freundii]|nr:hypothetical protein [Citrobacter freundii]